MKKFVFGLIAFLCLDRAVADDFDQFGEFKQSVSTGSEPAINPDPWEVFNRRIFSMNEAFDGYFFKPIAASYRAYVPESVDRGVSNFFNNIEEPLVVFNDILQLKIRQAASDSARFVTNTLLGFLGIFDVASHFGLLRHNEDFGQALGYWGVDSGPYVILPFLGPSSVRDGVATGMTMFGFRQFVPELYPDYAVLVPDHRFAYYSLKALELVDLRADIIPAESLISGDKYVFLRSAYFQRRQFLIDDGRRLYDGFDEEFFEQKASEGGVLDDSADKSAKSDDAF